MLKLILNLLFPIQCLACGKEGKFICSQCLGQIPFNTEPSASIHKNSLKGVIAVSDYKYPLVKKIVHCYKYGFIQELSKPLGTLMVKKLTAYSPRNPILIPVPLHQKRLRWRGFNQSELLAQEISQQLNIPIASNILIRAKNTSPQAKIEDPAQRKTNIQNAFTLTPPPNLQRFDLWRNKTIILVDDIATTGATLQQCAKVLAPFKPKDILGLVLAR